MEYILERFNINVVYVDGSGEIDLDEFRIALFAVDPNSGNSIGFNPNMLLTPADAFEMFDDDGSGEIGMDEFSDVLEYLGMEVWHYNLQLFLIR